MRLANSAYSSPRAASSPKKARDREHDEEKRRDGKSV